ncbi:hypothetical protein bthur0014_26050 [Bacillus thuringiensis IBL 4222]|nr:hypothetical protein bthur0011_25420 [Bacillus thuringiensis serovar huazhongensis BGSC 4BD1]EEN02691.1 hypothetical protein bthur0014_26050 [Bacillus thuringiensis IBL 4222]
MWYKLGLLIMTKLKFKIDGKVSGDNYTIAKVNLLFNSN